ncbi:hypothetical protein KI387_026326, partial [Taxus chinensis]
CDKEDTFNESRIMFAYNELGLGAQEAFLDICSFFSDWEWDEVACIVGEEELECLHEGALVKRIEVEKYCYGYGCMIKVRRISIHDLILTAGLNKSKGNRFRNADDFSKSLESEENSSDLQVLKLAATKIGAEFHHSHINAAIELEHHKKLKHLELSEFHIDNISSWQKLKLLQKLKLSDIKGLKELPRSIGNVQSLKVLYLRNCKEIEQLPASLGKLGCLQVLYLVGCEKLKQLPAGFGELSSPTKLDLRSCSRLQELPCDFLKLSALQSLDLYDCSSLLGLPE